MEPNPKKKRRKKRHWTYVDQRHGADPDRVDVAERSELLGRREKEYEMTLKRTLQSICLLTVHPNTTTSVVIQNVGPLKEDIFNN
ncbi:hypothetical protein U9M48_011238 [Paspalum notatum var. saurae]|uniref:Uncharacterized protein n=1 Tax=Paspalum notatum var. saurae TaxID=547442 RepID=A0AAQ3SVA8_PASNO